MLASGKFFASMLQGANVDLTKPKNAQRWVKVGKAYYFVLHTFNVADSASITAGLRTPTTFKFTDLGNISCGGGSFTFKNPLDRNTGTDYGITSIDAASKLSNQYVFDSNHVITQNLRYMLYKQASTWYLLYNSLHASEFKTYYNAVLATPNVLLDWGATPVATDSTLNLQQVFQTHCDAMQTTNANGTTTFLDPTCNVIYSSQQCRSSAFFSSNTTQYTQPQLDRNVTALNALGTNTPPLCVCAGSPHNYLIAHVDPTKSFARDFLNMSTCDAHLQMNMCQIIQEGGNVVSTDSQYNMQCGGDAQFAPSTTTDGSNLKDDGSAAKYKALLSAQDA